MARTPLDDFVRSLQENPDSSFPRHVHVIGKTVSTDEDLVRDTKRDAPSRFPYDHVPSRHVAEALPFLAMSLDEFQTRGAMLEVRVPWLDVTLWMVPDERDARALVAEGVGRGRIWTAGELGQLMSLEDRTPEGVKTITHAKLAVDGLITEVRRR